MPIRQRGKKDNDSDDTDDAVESPSSTTSSSPVLIEKSKSYGTSEEDSNSEGKPKETTIEKITTTRSNANPLINPHDNLVLSKQKPVLLDEFLVALSSWAANATTHERGLKVLQYLFWLFSRLTQNRKSLNPELSPGLRKMYGDLSMARYAMRLYGTPLSLEAIRTGSWSRGWQDKRIQFLGKIMAWSMLFYYPLEHIAYGRWVAPRLIKADAEKFSALSCRFWFVYVVADLFSSLLKLKELGVKKEEVLSLEGDKLLTEEAQAKLTSLGKTSKLTKLHVLRCLMYVFPALHWSLPKWERQPWLKENVVNGLMLSESLVCFYQTVCSLRK